MKIKLAKIVIFQEDNERPVWYSDPRKAAEHWARTKADEWVEKVKDDPKYQERRFLRSRTTNALYDAGRVRYRKLKRRALVVFRKAMNMNN